ncbi:bifunctional biotin--[acetyl-CoA-carboxylase] ligase/biotin operon repressor BirA [Sansalvadorimonas sp. 2012CJ34-2]|uniref:Bifunctional ligase/repressor BirA n=1 Tax=Parendozoicomonas callyspongiae TaxID=2942213 RepID=A0ABT0PFK6_9GAMM|nr:bifunctional biotin--[acetyl-CoA-carboxylase] ligase/biotin operon repressor BirA [Sansalvadorimonas sp. 2012CJ34-2]MCL6270016.1 bifunctional biotin--[acetyl-CoA-carboxylase] ligase/biotin operon repressor BirA [Sansalvadorimonas sp. 2012CJ34-2]
MENLLRLLADGRFHSGEELGSELGVSRAAVWKKLKALSALGLELDAVRGKGYRLPGNIELLNRNIIRESLPDDMRKSVGVQVELCTRSTNDDVRKLSAASEPWQVCMAEHQSHGRGRRGRTWQSPFGASLYFSMLWRVDGGLAALEGLSLAVGLAVVKTLESFGANGLKLKWPNDVLGNNKKLAGVLLEISGDPTGSCEVVIGIGINLALNRSQLETIDQPATDVREMVGLSVSKNELAGRLTSTLIDMLKTFKEYGFTPYRDEWMSRDAFSGQKVVLNIGGNKVTGVEAGVGENGALLLKTADGIQSFSGGEISVRKL